MSDTEHTARFWELVNEAHDAISQFDDFDLDSNDPESLSAFDHIEQNLSCRKADLIAFVLEHHSK